MSKTRQMQERDIRMLGVARDAVYRGEDKSLLAKGEMGAVEPKDHGARILLGKFSTFNLSYLTPEQRKIFLEELKFIVSLPAGQLNQYLSERYSEEDQHQIWLMATKGSKKRRRKVAPVPSNKARKRKISLKAQRRTITPEQRAAITAKAKATRERNKNDPNYVSYVTLKREFLRTQSLLVKRHEKRMKQAVEVYATDVIGRKVHYKTKRLSKQNQILKEYIKQNGLPLPGTQKAKMRREQLRRQTD